MFNTHRTRALRSQLRSYLLLASAASLSFPLIAPPASAGPLVIEEAAKLTSPEPSYDFGVTVAVGGNSVIVGGVRPAPNPQFAGQTQMAAFLFERKGLLSFPVSVDFEKLFEVALEAGAEDVKDEGDAYEVITDPVNFMEVRDLLVAAGLQFETAEVTMLPQTQVQLAGKQAESMLKLMDKLEDNDDVQNVYANFDISEEELANLDV